MLQAVLLAIGLLGIQWTGIKIEVETEKVFTSIAIGTSAAVMSYLVLMTFVRMNTAVSISIREQSGKLRASLLGWGYISIALVSFSTALGEETIFRLFFQDWIGTLATPWFGILVAALLFGLAHASSLTYFVISLALGAAIGLVYEISDDALLIIAWHFVYNCLALTVLVKHPGVLKLIESDREATH